MDWISPLISASGRLEASGDIATGQTLVITAFDGDDDVVAVKVAVELARAVNAFESDDERME